METYATMMARLVLAVAVALVLQGVVLLGMAFCGARSLVARCLPWFVVQALLLLVTLFCALLVFR